MAKAIRQGMLALLFMASEAAAQFCPGLPPWVFDDVPISHQFCTDITWMAQRGITLGCAEIDPNHRLYCPNDNVTRAQMAAFMFRLGFENAFLHGGNAFAETAIIGTTDNNALDIRVNDSRVMRYEPNAISPNVIGGSPANNVTGGVRGATIGGGGVSTGNTDPHFTNEAPNQVTDAYGTVGGGYGNLAGDDAGITTDAAFATVGGGQVNTASGFVSTVAGGLFNTASGAGSTVAGGESNTASGAGSTVAGGLSNTASGNFSFAAGRAANANADGCFVWGDNSTVNEVRCNAANRFVVRSLGGVFFFSAGSTQATYTGVELPPGATAWVPASDRRLKENLHNVDTRDVLDRLLALPISTWNLKSQDPSIRHMGAMAQDFRAAFGLGETELGISTLDADGVALAAIQGLNAKLETRIAEQAREIAELKQAFALLLGAIQDADRIAARAP